MADIDITMIAQALSRIQTNYSNMAVSWYNIFYNPTPMMVPVSWYDAEGNISEREIPNRAMDQKYIKNGPEAPEGKVIADVGTIYQDTTDGTAYIKFTDSGLSSGWSKIISGGELETLIKHGTGEPEGVVVAPIGTLYVREDLIQRGPDEYVGGYLYMKRTTTGNTGWERIDSFPASLIKETYILRRTDEPEKYDLYLDNTRIAKNIDGTQIELRGVVASKDILNVYLDGTCLTPDTFNLEEDLKTVTFVNGINFSETENSASVSFQYFMDVHLCDSTVYNEIVYLDGDARKFLYGDVQEVTLEDGSILPWDELPEEYKRSIYSYWLDVRDKALDITEAIENIGKTEQEAEEKLLDYEKELEELLKAYVAEVDVSWNAKYDDITKKHVEISQWNTIIRNNVATCQNWYEKTSALYKKIEEDKAFIEEEYEKGNIVTKWQTSSDMANSVWFMDLQNQITDNKGSIEEKVTLMDQALNYKIEETDQSRKRYVDSADDILRASISMNRENINRDTEAIANLRADFENADLGDFSNEKAGYYNAQNFPISKNGLLAQVGIANIDPESYIAEVSLNADIVDYVLDVTDFLEGNLVVPEEPPIEEEIPEEGDTSEEPEQPVEEEEIEAQSEEDEPVNSPEDGKLSVNINSDNIPEVPNNIALKANLTIINKSDKSPEITWTNDITWIGGQLQPEAGKSYIVEIISYDLGNTWFAKNPANQVEVRTN